MSIKDGSNGSGGQAFKIASLLLLERSSVGRWWKHITTNPLQAVDLSMGFWIWVPHSIILLITFSDTKRCQVRSILWQRWKTMEHWNHINKNWDQYLRDIALLFSTYPSYWSISIHMLGNPGWLRGSQGSSLYNVLDGVVVDEIQRKSVSICPSIQSLNCC